MELAEFITATLVSIRNGIHNANDELGKLDGIPHDRKRRLVFSIQQARGEDHKGRIQFDVAVVASEESKKEGSAGLKVAGLGGFGGETGEASAVERTSHVKFSVAIEMDVL